MATWHRFTAAGRTVRAVSFGTAMQGAATTRRRGWSHIAAAAAVAVLTVGLGWWWQHQPPSSFETGIGEHASIALPDRSEEHTSELQSLMRLSYAVFCLKK